MSLLNPSQLFVNLCLSLTSLELLQDCSSVWYCSVSQSPAWDLSQGWPREAEWRYRQN